MLLLAVGGDGTVDEPGLAWPSGGSRRTLRHSWALAARAMAGEGAVAVAGERRGSDAGEPGWLEPRVARRRDPV